MIGRSMRPLGVALFSLVVAALGVSGLVAQQPTATPPTSPAPATEGSPKRPQPNWRAFWTGQVKERAKDEPAKDQLRFNFRFQPWADVLTWFADRADLSLVLDAPPSGTFNYTDSRTYTTAEAIDLLNGVLLSKGYTLVRRDRMLMLLPLDKGVPRDLLPQVTPEELAQRGANELVSVLLPLGKRDPGEVATEIKPFLGPYGDVQTLAKTRQLLATGTAGKLRRAAEMIANIPEPQAPPTQPPPAGQEHPVLAAYPLGQLAAKPVLEVARTLLPDAKAVIDERTGQLLVMAVPSQQTTLASTLDLMRAETTPERRPVLKSHEVRGGDLGDLVRLLRETLPGAVFMADSSRGRIAALAPEAEQARISEMIATAALPTDQKPTLVAYTIQHGDPAALAQVVQPLVPQARLTADRTTSQLAALATPVEHEQIREALAKVDQPPAGPQQLRAETYKVDPSQSADVTTMLASLVPAARVRPDPKAAQIVVLAADDAHRQIADLLQRVGAEQPAAGATLQRYELNGTDPSLAASTMQSAVPEARFVADTRGGALLAWARDDQHQQIADNLKKMIGEGGDRKPIVKTYRPERADVSALTSVVSPQVPYARLTIDTKTGSLMATATPEEHALIAAALAQLDAEQTAGGATLQRYDLAGADPSLVTSLLQTAVPEARFTADTRGGALLAWAKADQHQLIADNLKKLTGEGGDRKPVVKTYRPERADVSALTSVVAPQVPYARLTIDTKTGSLVATATPEEHALIAAALAQLDAEQTAGGATLHRYDLAGADPSLVTSLLQTAVPEARFTADTRGGAVLAWAKPDQHQLIAENLKQLDGRAAGGQPEARVYRPQRADVSALYTAMATQTPYARLSIDTRTGSLVATATPREHDLIAAVLKQLEDAESGDRAPRLEVYEMQAAEPTGVVTTLRTLFGSRTDVQISYDAKTSKLLVRAPEEQQAIVRDVLREVDGQAGPAEMPQLMVHALGAADPATVLQLATALTAKAPEAKIIGDGRSGQLTVMARAELQSSIKAAIAELQAAAPEVEVVPLSVVDPFDAEQAVERLFGERTRGGVAPPEAEADVQSSRLLVRGTKEQLAEIRQLLAKMGEPLAERSSSNKRLRVVSLPNRDTRELVEDLKRLWPNVGRNPIRVVTPSAVVPTWKDGAPATGGDEKPAEPPASPSPASAPAQPSPRQSSALPLWLLPSVVAQQSEGAGAGAPPPAVTEPTAQETPPAPTVEEQDVPPIIIAPGPGGVTIASDDPEALDQIESLLRTLAAQNAQPGREFNVFPLKNAPAMSVAELLRRAFGGSAFGGLGFGSSGSVSVVADTRLNAVIVRAGPNDLAAIEALLEVLDSADIPSTSITTRVERIPVVHSDATEIAEVLRDTFRTALTSSVSRQQLPMARGVSRDISALLDELNRSASGPEMTISVDERTNSLLVLAPEPLLKEVRSVVEQLDKAAEGAPRSVRVVKLQHTNAEAVERALQMLGDERGAGGQRSTRRRRGGP